MRKSSHLSLFLTLLLSLSPVCAAQTPTTNCDQLRRKIERLEKMDLNAMSSSLQQIYREALLKLYVELRQCVQRELAAATEIRQTVADTPAAPGVETSFQTLSREKTEADNKITILSTALNLPAPAPDNGMRPRTAPIEDPAADEPVDEAPSAPSAPPAGAQTALPCLPGAAYPEAPPLLTDIVTRDAKDIARGRNDGAIASVSKMTLYATLDAASPTSSTLLRALEPYQYLSETARTDKQLGASAKSNGAVSAIEKPGFARLLGFAVEHGAINKENDGTNLTLSTSLYSLYMINSEDTAETYARAGVLNRVGVSSTFALQNKDSELSNARRNNLSEWSVKARLFGDRSTRAPGFQKFWQGEIEPLIDARLEALGQPLEDIAAADAKYPRLRTQSGRCLRTAVADRLQAADYKAATTEEARVKILADLMLGILRTNVYDRVKSGHITLDDKTVAAIETRYVPNLRVALANLKNAKDIIEKQLDHLNKSPLGTFAYTNHRIPTGSDYSEAKFLWEQGRSFLRPLKMTGNVGMTFYHRPDASLQQKKVRDVSAAISFEGTRDSPFTEAENQSKVTYSFVGRYDRLFENRRRPDRKPDLATAQFVVEIPFVKGFSLPFSLTYANATEEERKKNVRFNFGFRLDTDKLIELLTTTPR